MIANCNVTCRLFMMFIVCLFYSISQGQSNNVQPGANPCSDKYKAKNQSAELSCKLSSKKLVKRKETVLNSLKMQILEIVELPNGFAFKFPGSDAVVDELTEFIKTERTCCDFFVFGLSISGDKSEAWLELTGPEGAKVFVSEELGLVSSEW